MSRTLLTTTLIAIMLTFSGMANAQPVIEVMPDTLIIHGSEYNPVTLIGSFSVRNGGDDPLNWTASWSESWLDVVPFSGTAPSSVDVRVTSAELPQGFYSDQIMIMAPAATNSPFYVIVNFLVDYDSTGCQGWCGNSNGDVSFNISDAVYLINYIFVNGSPPVPVLACGDINGDCKVDVSDVVWGINELFIEGPQHDDCCPGGWEDQGGDCCPFDGH